MENQRATTRVKTSHNEILVEYGFTEVRDDVLGHPVAVTGVGTFGDDTVRVLDGHRRVALGQDEGMIVRSRREDRWWYIGPDVVREAHDLAVAEGRGITITDPRHVLAHELPGDSSRRNAELIALRANRGRPPRRTPPVPAIDARPRGSGGVSKPRRRDG